MSGSGPRGSNQNEKRKKEISQLFSAVSNGDAEIVEQLIKQLQSSGTLVKDINEVDDNGATPLHIAAARGHLDVIKILLNFKANINQQDLDGNTAAHYAAANHSSSGIEVVEILEKAGADVNKENNYGETASQIILNNQPHIKGRRP